MFLSKIWFVVVAVVAAIAITIALVVARPGQRDAVVAEGQRLRRSCQVARIVMKDNAWSRAQLASQFATAMRGQLSETLRRASDSSDISADYNATGRKFLKQLAGEGTLKFSFIWVLDNNGRVVARDGQGADKGYGDTMAGYHVVADALDGFVRDDLWDLGGQLYRVAAAPVLDSQLNWAGAVVVGHAIDTEFAQLLGEQANATVAFYLGQTNVAASDTISIHQEIAEHAKSLSNTDAEQDCATSKLLEVRSGNKIYNAIAARLPGEAGALGAFYSVFSEQQEARGFMAALRSIEASDVSYRHFPWIRVALVLLLLIGIGVALMIYEVDKPIRTLNTNAISLAKGEVERLQEDLHRGKLGSIARSVNIAIDKLNRETKAAKKDLDQLLGPAPDVATGTPVSGGFDASASALPNLMAKAAPPPSEFAFSDSRTPHPNASATPKPSGVTPPPALPTLLPQVTPMAPATNQQIVPKPVALPQLPVASIAPPKNPAAQLADATPSSLRGQLPPPNKDATLQTTPPPGSAMPAFSAIDDDILGASNGSAVDDEFSEDPATRIFPPQLEAEETQVDAEENYFRTVYDEFIEVKERCGEATGGLSFDKFADKLRTNRNALMSKHNCASVRFQVYVRDGKAALKASPVRDSTDSNSN